MGFVAVPLKIPPHFHSLIYAWTILSVGWKKQWFLKRPEFCWLYQVGGQGPSGLENHKAKLAGQKRCP